MEVEHINSPTPAASKRKWSEANDAPQLTKKAQHLIGQSEDGFVDSLLLAAEMVEKAEMAEKSIAEDFNMVAELVTGEQQEASVHALQTPSSPPRDLKDAAGFLAEDGLLLGAEMAETIIDDDFNMVAELVAGEQQEASVHALQTPSSPSYTTTTTTTTEGDKEAIVCQDAALQKGGEPMENVLATFKALNEQRERVSDVVHYYHERKRIVEKQASRCEQHIRDMFSEVISALVKQEVNAFKALDEDRKTQHAVAENAENAARKTLEALDINIGEIRKQLLEDKLYNSEMAFEPTDVPPKTDIVLNEAAHLGNLRFRMWDGLSSLAGNSPIILDPNTASLSVKVSPDLRGLSYCEQPERNIYRQSYMSFRETVEEEYHYSGPSRFDWGPVVIGSQGFSGRDVVHFEVDTGDHSRWEIGFIKGSARRKTERADEDDLWCLALDGSKLRDGNGKLIAVINYPRLTSRLGVSLNCGRGVVTFSGASQKFGVYTFRLPELTEKLYPYFFVGESLNSRTQQLTICDARDKKPL